MRQLALLASLLALGLILFLLLFRSEVRVPLERPVVEAPVVHDVNDAATNAAHDADLASNTDVADRKVVIEARSTTNSAESIATPRCRILGRIVDEDGAPISDAYIVVAPVHTPWSDSEHLSLTSSSVNEFEHLETRTQPDGRFTLDAPVPTTDLAAMSVESTIYHSLARSYFGPGGVRNKPRLLAGENDLGEIALRSCGAIEGHVRASDGSGIVGANVFNRSGTVEGADKSARTDADGHFVLGYLPEGKAVIDVLAENWSLAKPRAFKIQRNETMHVDDIVLVRSSTISGIVVDANGAPIPNIKVDGRGVRGGNPISATCGAEGKFSFSLRYPEPYTLSVEGVEGFQPWHGESGAKAYTFEPGSSNARIVLVRNTLVAFHVVDAATKAPIENFGIALEEKPAPGEQRGLARKDLRREIHPGGVAELPATPGIHRVSVDAKGHASTWVDVALDAASVNVQTIALVRASTLRGQVFLGKESVASVRVLLQRDTLKSDGTNFEYEGSIGPDLHTDVDEYSGRKRTKTTDAEGRFEFGELAGGTYSLQFKGAGIARASRRAVFVPKEQVLDLGRIDIDPESRIVGRFIAARGESLIGYQVRLDDGAVGDVTIERVDGKFEFGGIAAGKHSLRWARPGQSLDSGKQTNTNLRHVELGVGETRAVEIDLAEFAPCTVNVRVMRKGEPVVGAVVQIEISARADSGSPSYPLHADEAKTDASGRASLKVDGGTHFNLVALANKRLLGDGGMDLIAIGGGVLERTIEVRSGSIELQLPPTLANAPSGSYLRLTGTDERGSNISAIVATPDTPGMSPIAKSWSSGLVDLGEFPPGKFDVTITFQSFVADSTAPKGIRTTPLHAPYTTKVTIEEAVKTRVLVLE